MGLRVIALLLALLKSAFAYSVDDANADHTEMAIELDEAGDTVLAIASFRAHVKFNPADGAGWANLATILEESGGDEQEIGQCREKSADLNPYDVDDPDADHFSQAIRLEEAGDKTSALASFKAHVEFNPEDVPGWKNYMAALEGEEGEEALERRRLCERKIRYWEHMQTLDVAADGSVYSLEDPEADHVDRGVSKAEGGESDAAIASFRAAIKFRPNDELGWLNLHAALRAFHVPDVDEEIALCKRKIAELHPYALDDDQADHFEHAVKMDEKGDLHSAIASFRAHTKFYPGDSAGWSNLAIALEKTGKKKDYFEAKKHRQQAQEIIWTEDL